MKKLLMVLIIVVGLLGLSFDMYYNEVILTPLTSFDSLILFKYFTIQSNMIAVLYFFLMFMFKAEEKSILFKKFMGCVTISIMLTFTMFAIFLSPIWHPEGLGAVASILFHYVNPLLVLTYFVMFHKEYSFQYKDVILWIIYPISYLIFAIIHGIISEDYLYPFLDIEQLGVFAFLVSVLSMLVGYLGLSFLIVKIVSQKIDKKM